MINRLKSLLSKEPAAAELASFGDRPLALAVLLVEAAYVDGAFDDAERAKVGELARRRFELSDAETASLIETAESLHREAVDLVRFTRVVKDSFAPEERVKVIEMLWEVVYAGRPHRRLRGQPDAAPGRTAVRLGPRPRACAKARRGAPCQGWGG